VLAVLDAAAASGNEETENVVAVSFCEGIESESFFPRLQPCLVSHFADTFGIRGRCQMHANKPLVPTRNGEAPLLAAQRRRWMTQG
jgi:hypothetical protein